MEDKACPQCHAIDFIVGGRVRFFIGCTIQNGEAYYRDEEDFLWDTQELDYMECTSCGWGIDVPEGNHDITEMLAPMLDKSVEDLPDEEELDAKVPGDTERKNSANVLSGS